MTITAKELVEREVFYCVSSLVSTLASNYGLRSNSREMEELVEQAMELCSPIPDYEEAAIQEGFKMDDEGSIVPNDPDTEGFWEDWQSCCEANGIEPYDREVFEHWIISDWLADKLIAKGEKVDKDFAGMTVWARTTTGQAIYMDHVIQEIHRDLVSRA